MLWAELNELLVRYILIVVLLAALLDSEDWHQVSDILSRFRVLHNEQLCRVDWQSSLKERKVARRRRSFCRLARVHKIAAAGPRRLLSTCRHDDTTRNSKARWDKLGDSKREIRIQLSSTWKTWRTDSDGFISLNSNSSCMRFYYLGETQIRSKKPRSSAFKNQFILYSYH